MSSLRMGTTHKTRATLQEQLMMQTVLNQHKQTLTLESLLEEPKQQLSTIVAEDSSSVGIDRQNMGTYSVVEFLFGIS